MNYTCFNDILVCPAFLESQAAAPPVNIHKCMSEVATDYTKKQNVLRLHLYDGAEYLLEFHTAEEMHEWMTKIHHYAGTVQLHSLTC